MAITVGERLEQLWEESPGLGSWLGTVDHKRIGKRYVYTAFVFFLAGGIEALIVRAQLTRPDEQLVGPQTFHRVSSSVVTCGYVPLFVYLVTLRAPSIRTIAGWIVGSVDLVHG